MLSHENDGGKTEKFLFVASMNHLILSDFTDIDTLF